MEGKCSKIFLFEEPLIQRQNPKNVKAMGRACAIRRPMMHTMAIANMCKMAFKH
jgi:predicted signal transduction protein with EAL and GGDEF domain